MYLQRSLAQRLKNLHQTFPAVVVSGARQVGKSTLLQHSFPRHDLVVFDPVVDVENARGDPDLFLSNHRTPLILDEIQFAPEVVAALKRRIDRDRSPAQYILTGSQQWGVLKSMAESLAGRAVFLDLEGFSLAEIADSASPESWLTRWLTDPDSLIRNPPSRLRLPHTLYEQLWRGWLPEAQFLPRETIADFHLAYLRTYVERDARLLADISDWQLFGRFYRLAGALTAEEINYSELGRDLGLNPQTSKRWLAILQATFQWFEVPAFSGNPVKRVSAKPKGFLADTGLICHAQAIASPTQIGGHPLYGPLFETAVMAEIRKQAALLSPQPTLYHWRAHSGAEVDILLEYNGRLFPMEVKGNTNPSRKETRGLTAFRNTYPSHSVAPGLVIAPVEKFFPLSHNDYALPWDSDR